MKISRIGRGRLLGLGLVGAVAVGGAAFAASNTVPDSNAGQGPSVVAGFTVSSVAYSAKTEPDQAELDTVSFTIARDGTNSGNDVNSADADVLVRLNTGAGYTTYVTCSVAVGAASCDFASQNVTFNSIVGLDVVAYDK